MKRTINELEKGRARAIFQAPFPRENFVQHEHLIYGSYCCIHSWRAHLLFLGRTVISNTQIEVNTVITEGRTVSDCKHTFLD